jgi:hypothetical protein
MMSVDGKPRIAVKRSDEEASQEPLIAARHGWSTHHHEDHKDEHQPDGKQ